MANVMEYQDPVDGLRGWLAYDGDSAPIAAGGCRVQYGVDATHLATLAGRMTLKQRVLGLNVDGAKCGIDYMPRSDGKRAALGRFIAFIRDELRSRYSMGPDMGTEWHELQELAALAGVPSIKYAIRTAQGLTEDEFFTRMGRLEQPVGMLTLGQRRAGHAMAHAVIGAGRASGVDSSLTVAMQGFGNLGRAAAYTLMEEGVRVVAVADEYGCVADPAGLAVADMLASPHSTPVPQFAVAGQRSRAEDVFDVPADVLVLAACADAMGEKETAAPPFRAVVVGANCGLSEEAEAELHARDVLVVPDFIGGIGGSASMEALFGPRRVPSPRAVLDNLAHMMRELVDDLAATSRRHGVAPRVAALRLATRTVVDPAAPPYGHSPYFAAHAD